MRTRPGAGAATATTKRAAAVAICAAALACAMPTETSFDTSDFEETHHAILDGVVRGSFNQPLEDVNITVVFAGEGPSFSPPSTRTDGAGQFLLVLAIYNGDKSANDSVNAVVHAVTTAPSYSVFVGDQEGVLIRFAPVTANPPRTSLAFSLPVP